MPKVTVSFDVRPSPIPLLRWGDIRHPERAVAEGAVVRVRHGVYAVARVWNDLPSWDRYLARVHAVAMTHPGAVFCLESAAALIGMPVFGDRGIVDLLVDSAETARFSGGVRTHRSHPERTLIEHSGLAVTSPGDTAVDLARHRHHAIGLAAADAALRLDPRLSHEHLVALNEARVSKRGRNIARWPLHRSTRRAESALESISRAVIEWLGFPAPELQTVFRSPSGEEDRCDFFWPAARVGGESDGDLKYDGRFGDARGILRRQAARDIRLRTHHVRHVAHWGWAEATAFTPLRGILAGAGLVQIAAEDSLPLHSMRRLLSQRPPHATAPTRESATVR